MNEDYQPGEIWQEADGCALLYVGRGRWMGFGVAEPFTLDDAPGAPAELPLRRLLTFDPLTSTVEIAPERLENQ